MTPPAPPTPPATGAAPRVSVLIPNYNRAGLLPATLDSLLGQTLPPYEIIVADQDSTDDIASVKGSYGDRVMFVRNPGRGAASGRNVALEASTGALIQYFDSDDLLTPDKLELQARALIASGRQMCLGPYAPAQEVAPGLWRPTDVVLQAHPPGGRPMGDYFALGWNAITQSILVTRELALEAGPWPRHLIPHEDLVYMYHLCRLEPRPVHEGKAAVIYRQHGAQVTDGQTTDRRRGQDRLAALAAVRAAMKRDGAPAWHRALLEARLQQTARYLGQRRPAPADLPTQGVGWGYPDDPAMIPPGTYRYPAQDLEALKLSPLAPAYDLALRTWNALARRRTGTEWEPMHGTAPARELLPAWLDSIGARMAD